MNLDINGILRLPKILGIGSFKSALLFLGLGFLSNLLIFKIRDLAVNNYLWLCNRGVCDFFPLSLDLIKIIAWIFLYLMLRRLVIRLQPYWHSFFKDWMKKKSWYDYPEIVFSKNSDRFYQEWNMQGFPILNKQGLVFTNSEAGCLIKPKTFLEFWIIRLGLLWYGRVWKNFKATFTVEFKEQKIKALNSEKIIGTDYTEHTIKKPYVYLIGIVFRAQSFDDYFMLEIWKKNSYLSIRPHVRVFGNWDAPMLNPDVSAFPLKSKNLKKFEFCLIVEDEVVKLIINSDEENPLVWLLPSHYQINLARDQNYQSNDLKSGVTSKIPFKDMAGMFGFRNYGNEIAIIKNLKVEPL